MTLYFNQNFNYICNDNDDKFKTYWAEDHVTDGEIFYVAYAETGCNLDKKTEDFAYRRANIVMRNEAFFEYDDFVSFVDGFLSAFCKTATFTVRKMNREDFFEAYGITKHL